MADTLRMLLLTERPDLTWNHLVRVFILFGEAILSLRHVCRKDSSGFARLRGSAGGRAWGEGKSHGEAWKQCQSEKGSNCELKEILNCVQEQGGRIRSGSDRVIV